MIPFLNQKIWYAFQGLPIETVEDNIRLPWSKCSVLTNNLMYILRFENLSEYFSNAISKTEAEENQGVTFKEYIAFINSYLKTEKQTPSMSENRNSSPINADQESVPPNESRPRKNTFDSLTISEPTAAEDKRNVLNDDMSKLIKTFNDYSWTLYRTKHIPYLGTHSPLHDSFYNLWLLFIAYSVKEGDSKTVKIPVVMDLIEAKYWYSRIQEQIGSRRVVYDIGFEEEVTEITFKEFYEMIQDLITSANIDEVVLKLVFSSLTEEALEGVLMKGPIRVDRYVRYCVLKSTAIIIYNSKVSTIHYKSKFIISKETEMSAGGNKIQLRTAGSTITLETNDVQLLNKWRTAISDAIYFAKNNICNYAIHEAENREKARQVRRREMRSRRLSVEYKLKEERQIQLEKLEMIEKERQLLNEQLQATKDEKSLEEQKRTYLEEKHVESLQMLSAAEERILSLKKLGDELTKALEEERQAKEEEEAVRNATMKLLEEEKQSKLKLEDLFAQQADAINSEILKSSKIAEDLENERMRIKQIAEEKEKLVKQLEDSQKRQQTTGKRVMNLDSKVTKIAESLFWREDSKIPISHRGQGFIAEIMVHSQLKENQKRLQDSQRKESLNESNPSDDINENI